MLFLSLAEDFLAFPTEDRKEWLLDSSVHEAVHEVLVPVKAAPKDLMTFESPSGQGE